MINAGLYILNKGIMPYLSDGTLSFENDVLPRIARKGIYGLVQKGFFVDIGIPDDYINLCSNPQKLSAD